MNLYYKGGKSCSQMYPSSRNTTTGSSSSCYQCPVSQRRNSVSSSSSQSESEEDTMLGNPMNIKSKWGSSKGKTTGSSWRKNYDTTSRRPMHTWGGSEECMSRGTGSRDLFQVINLEEEGFSPEDEIRCTCKVDVSRRILILKIQSQNKKIRRVLPLESNIRCENLRVVHQPQTNELIITAPFTTKGTSSSRQKSLPLEEEEEGQWPTSHFPSSKSCKHYGTSGRGCFYDTKLTTTLHPSSSSKNQLENEKELQKSKMLEKTLRPEYIRDESNNQVSMLVQVDTLGFSPEEIRVQVDEKEKLLIIECNKEQQQQQTQQQELLRNLPVKSLRREFILPEWVDVNKIGFRVMQNGLLSIKLPLTSSGQEEFKNKEKLSGKGEESQQLYSRDWKKPLWG